MSSRPTAESVSDEILSAARNSRQARGIVLAGLLMIVGGVFAAMGLFPGVEEALVGAFPVERLLLLAVGFQFFYIAVLLRAKERLRSQSLELMEQILDTFYGKTYRAVDILVRALRGRSPEAAQTAIKNLKRLTGEDLGEDPEAWREWWRAHRDEFRTRGAGVRRDDDEPA